MSSHQPLLDALTGALVSLVQGDTTPIIALSANVLPEHVDEAERAGMNDHIGKPIVPAKLFAVLNRWAGVRVTPAREVEVG